MLVPRTCAFQVIWHPPGYDQHGSTGPLSVLVSFVTVRRCTSLFRDPPGSRSRPVHERRRTRPWGLGKRACPRRALARSHPRSTERNRGRATFGGDVSPGVRLGASRWFPSSECGFDPRHPLQPQSPGRKASSCAGRNGLLDARSVDAFAIVSSDADFTHLVMRILAGSDRADPRQAQVVTRSAHQPYA